MADLGQMNRLTVLRVLDIGAILDGNKLGDILLPARQMPDTLREGSELDVFVYLDSEDQPIATTAQPKVMVGQCAYLKVVDVNPVGAFMDWGLPKDLLLPYAEQAKKLQPGMHKVVYVYVDRASSRITASARLDKHLHEENRHFVPGQAVDVLFCGHSDLGYKGVINNTHLGLLHHSDVMQPVRIGQRTTAYIKSIHPSGKINLALHLPNKKQLGELAEQILADLEANGGESLLTDRSSPEDIKRKWQVSKGSYKKALGALYKNRKIIILPDRIQLNDSD
ncbi:CvfB family protein [Marinicella meishanensis]|uniref:CvfB family protein n=1 Tax=Marinicella meishanensis TaxID=2873263 RepID=UPI001CBB79A3|nr:S1-like domain-containing RNA-binding protein [Marinicella sp. NBU2979]